jgi:hypothetical protein
MVMEKGRVGGCWALGWLTKGHRGHVQRGQAGICRERYLNIDKRLRCLSRASTRRALVIPTTARSALLVGQLKSSGFVVSRLPCPHVGGVRSRGRGGRRLTQVAAD